MRLAVEREALYTALSRVAKIAPKNAPNPVLSFVKIEAFEDELFISATDLSTRIVAEVVGQLKVEKPGTCLLPANELFLVLRASGSHWVGLAADGGSQVQMGIGRTSYRWKTLPPDHFPDILTLNTEAESHILDRVSFIDAVQAVRPALQRVAEARFDQIGVANGVFRAADGNRYFSASLEDAPLLNVALPSDFVTDVLGLANSSAEEKLVLGISEDRKAVSVRVGPTILMTRTQAEEFPNIDSVFVNAKMTNQESLEVNREALLGAVRRVRMVADPESGAIALKLTGSAVEVSARQQSGSRASEPVDAVWVGEERTLVVHHGHLVSLLEMLDHDTARLMIGPDSRHKPGSIYASDVDRTGVIMQLRMRWHDDTL